MIRVYITSCERGADAWSHQAETLIGAFPAENSRLVLVNDAESADLIFLTDLRDRGDHFANLRNHPLVKKYPDRCFAISEDDHPPIWLRGIQASAKKTFSNLRRFSSASYFLYHPDFKNPFVEKFAKVFPRPINKQYLFSFTGRSCNALRARLFEATFTRSDILIRDTSSFNNFSHDSRGEKDAKLEYAQVLAASKFALCPRGNGAASIRLFEAMSLGVAPVIISDQWLLPRGINWDEFAIFVHEDSIENVETILCERESQWEQRGNLAKLAYEKYFTGEAYVRYVVDSALDLKRNEILPEPFLLKLWPALVLASKISHKINQKTRALLRVVRSDRH